MVKSTSPPHATPTNNSATNKGEQTRSHILACALSSSSGRTALKQPRCNRSPTGRTWRRVPPTTTSPARKLSSRPTTKWCRRSRKRLCEDEFAAEQGPEVAAFCGDAQQVRSCQGRPQTAGSGVSLHRRAGACAFVPGPGYRGDKDESNEDLRAVPSNWNACPRTWDKFCRWRSGLCRWDCWSCSFTTILLASDGQERQPMERWN